MRILMCTQQLASSRSGVGTYARALVEGLSSRGHRVTAVAPHGEAMTLERAQCITVGKAKLDPSPGGWISLSCAFAREVTARATDFDLVFFTDAREAWLANKRIAPVVGMVNDCYALDWLQGSYPRYVYSDRFQRALYYRFARLIEQRTYSTMTRLLANSEYVARELVFHYKPDADIVRVVRYGLAPSGAISNAHLDGLPAVLFVGGNFQRKGLPVLLEAIKGLLPDFPDLRLHVVGGDRNQPALEDCARKLGILGRVSFHGWQPNEAVLGMMAAADVFALPSWTEAFGLVYLEAMRLGTPVVATAVGGLSEVVKDGEHALLVQPGSSAELAQALRRVFSERGLADRLGKAGRAFCATLTTEAMVDQTEQVLLEVVRPGAEKWRRADLRMQRG